MSFFLLAGVDASAQITVTGDLQVSPGGTVFTHDAATFKLTASGDDSQGVTYTKFAWAEVNAAGGGTPIGGQESAELQLSNVTPGYHIYRVQGIKNNGDDVICNGDWADFTVYVLPRLKVMATIPNATILKYCADAVPSSGGANEILITAAVTGFDDVCNVPKDMPNHTFSEFAYEYKWFRISADNTRTEVAGANESTYSVNTADIGSYKYEVQIAFKVNSGTWFGTVAQSNGGDAQIIVAPKPGKPTITIM
ncbi:MAG TPA: hypothetical protein VGE26_03590 [Sphingobacteriaceae bacterium]